MKQLISFLLCTLMLFAIIPTASANAGSDFASAIPYTMGTTISGNTKTYYKFDLANPGKIAIDITSNAWGTDLYLYDATGENILSFINIGYSATKGALLCAGTYYIYTKNRYDATCNFSITETPTYESFPEPQGGNNNTLKTANAITAGYLYTGFLADNDDTDVYRIELNESGKLEMDLSGKMASVDIELLDENGKRVWNSNTGINKITGETAFSGGFYLLRGIYYFVFKPHIESYKGIYGYGEYQFYFLYTSAGESIPESVSYTNNEIATATPITMNVNYHGQFAMNDLIDYYRIEITSPNPTLYIFGNTQNITLNLYNTNQAWLWQTKAKAHAVTEEISSFHTMSVPAGTYYLAIEGTDVDYSFYITDGSPVTEYQVVDTTPATPDVPSAIFSTDILAYIDGYPIRSFNIDGNTAVVVEDLIFYGFQVTYNPEKRALYIDEDGKTVTALYQHFPNIIPAGTKLMDVYDTDIKTYSYGYEIRGFNANGFTLIYLDDLTAFGRTYWDEENRTISFYRY